MMGSAAKRIRKLIESGQDTDQVQVLKNLATSLELGSSFELSSLYEIDMEYFDLALELIKDWRFDRRISSRSKLLEQLLIEIAPEEQVKLASKLKGEKGEKSEPADK